MPDVEHAPAVNGATRLYGIIGDPIAQVRSPAAFNDKFRTLGVNAVLVPLQAQAADFADCMRGLKALANLDGMLVTLPHKISVMAHVDTVLPAARRIGAMNALRRESDGTWSGDMFDGKGFLGGLRASGVDPKDLAIMLIGAGGAGSAIADALAEAGAAAITVFDRNEQKTDALVRTIAQSHPQCRASKGHPTVEGIDVLVNATPVGMRPGDGLPGQFGRFDKDLFVADIIPNPEITPLLAHARDSGCRAMGGQAMVAGQVDALLQFFGLV